MITYSHALGVRDLPFSEIQSYFPWHCTFLNDANAGAFAEGIGSDLPSSFFYLSLSNTVGGAIFHDGNLLPGDAFRCGEAGHMTLIPAEDLVTVEKPAASIPTVPPESSRICPAGG